VQTKWLVTCCTIGVQILEGELEITAPNTAWLFYATGSRPFLHSNSQPKREWLQTGSSEVANVWNTVSTPSFRFTCAQECKMRFKHTNPRLKNIAIANPGLARWRHDGKWERSENHLQTHPSFTKHKIGLCNNTEIKYKLKKAHQHGNPEARKLVSDGFTASPLAMLWGSRCDDIDIFRLCTIKNRRNT
jgi:hypothetical protein